MSLATLALSLSAIFGSAFLRGFTGFGFALAAVPLLSLAMEPQLAVAVALLLQLVAGLTDLPKAARVCHWASLRPLMLGAVLTIPLGMLALTSIDAAQARLVISCITLLALAMVVFGRPFSAVPRVATSMAFGATAGLFSGLAAMPGPPAVLYYLMTPLATAQVRASLIVFFLSTAVIGSISAVWFGVIDRAAITLALIGVVALWVGNWLGTRAFQRAGDRSYRPIAITCLAAIAVTGAIPALRDLLS